MSDKTEQYKRRNWENPCLCFNGYVLDETLMCSYGDAPCKKECKDNGFFEKQAKKQIKKLEQRMLKDRYNGDD